MAAFPRTKQPASVSPFSVPGPLISHGHSGKDQRRATLQIGRSWTETWPPLRADDADVQALLTFIRRHWASGDSFTIAHLATPGSGLDPNGAGGGTPVVNGASQTGTSLVTDGWSTGVTDVVKTGDVIKISGLTPLYEITADANSDGSGNATLSIYPSIPTGSSPADNAPITRSGCTLTAYITEPPNIPDARRGSYFIVGLQVAFKEAL